MNPTPHPQKQKKPNYNFSVESVSLGQDLASELGKCGCLSPRPAWDISIPVGAVMRLFSADFVSLHKGQVKLFWSQLIQVQTPPSAKLVQIIFEQIHARCKETESRVWPVVFP